MSYSSKFKLSVFSLLSIFFLTTDVMAYKIIQRDLDELFEDSKQVSRVIIIGSNRVQVDENNRIYNCGYDYTANVISSFKGDSVEFIFRSFSQLNTGGEYLVFLNLQNLGAQAKYMSMGKNDKDGYLLCNKGSNLFASSLHGEILEFDTTWSVITGQPKLKIAGTPPYIHSLDGERITLHADSEKVPKLYLEAMSFWIIPWVNVKDKLKRK